MQCTCFHLGMRCVNKVQLFQCSNYELREEIKYTWMHSFYYLNFAQCVLFSSASAINLHGTSTTNDNKSCEIYVQIITMTNIAKINTFCNHMVTYTPGIFISNWPSEVISVIPSQPAIFWSVPSSETLRITNKNSNENYFTSF